MRISTTSALLLIFCATVCFGQLSGPAAIASAAQNLPTRQVSFALTSNPLGDPNLSILTLTNELVGGNPHLLLKQQIGPFAFSTVQDLSNITPGGGLPPISSSGIGFLVSTEESDLSGYLDSGVGGTLINVSENSNSDSVYAYQFYLPVQITIGRCSVSRNGTSGGSAGTTVSVGYYNSSGNKLLDSGAIDVSGTPANGIYTATFTPVTLNPGVLYFVQSSHFVGVSSPNVYGNVQFALGSTGQLLRVMNAVTSVRYGKGANTASGGVLPATLGALSAAGGASWPSLIYAVCEP